MTQIIPVSYLPDVDNAWISNPGALASISNFAPLARGSYGTIGSVASYEITGTNYLYAKMFRSLSGAVRFMVFRVGDIDEYSTSGTLTNRKTGASASTTNWCAAAWGDAIIATNYLDAVQSSVSGAFTDLTGTGSPPKARLVAANQNFVMLADYDDGGTYPDGWWCSGIGNYASWTANPLVTQATNGRLLDVPGPIRALVAYKDAFVAFKDHAVIAMEYIGPPLVWAARTIHASVGCHGMHAVAELRGILYFLHSSGVYAFDGTNVTSIGDPVENTMLLLLNQIDRNNGPTQTVAADADIANVQAVADDVENVVWFFFSSREENAAYPESGTEYVCKMYGFGFNVVTGKWARLDSPNYAYRPIPVHATHSEIKASGFSLYARARLLTIKTPAATSKLYAYCYPYQTTTSDETHGAGTMQTGVIGEHGKTTRSARVYWHTTYDAECVNASQVATVAAYGYKNSGKTFATGSATGAVNTTLDCGDVQLAAPFIDIRLTTPATIPCELVGIGVDLKQQGQQ